MNKGKQFEQKFKECWYKALPNSFLLRLADQVSGYKTVSQNPCDFIGFNNPRLYLIECKETTTSTLNWSMFSQYDRLAQYNSIKGVVTGVLIWFQNHDKILFVSIKDCIKMHEEDKKSINVKDLGDNKYNIIDVSGIKKRVFMDVEIQNIVNVPENW